jgi:hypothetical protein
MRQAKHLHPEWGILAPPQNVVRTVRILLMTAAVSAAACAGVMLSLVDRMSDQATVAARTLAIPTDTPTAARIQPLATLLNAQVKSPGIIESEPAKAAPSLVARTKPLADSAPAQKKASKKHHVGQHYASRGREFTSLMDDWYHAVGL